MSPEYSPKSVMIDSIPDAPLFTVEVKDADMNLSGWVVIHSFGAGGACGGVRLYPDVNVEEVSLLARAMTYKYSFFERDSGGAKAGLQLPFDLPKEKRHQMLRNYGTHIGPLLRSHTYVPWTDMNCGLEELKCISEGAGIILVGIGDSAYYTALSTFAGVLASAQHFGISPGESRITIEGLGNVGMCAAKEISRWGGRLIGASTRVGGVSNPDGLNVDEIIKTRQERGDEWVMADGNWDRISREELFSLPMNIHLPCARVHSLSEKVADDINAKAVVPAANVPCTPEGESRLLSKGVALLPDFIINGGGIVGTGLGDVGCSDQQVRNIFFEDFKDMIVRLLQLSEKKNESAIHLAKAVAHEKYKLLWLSGMTTASPSLLKRVYRGLARRGLAPKFDTKREESSRLIRIIRERFQ